jgi:hypothetical protein
VNTNAEAFDFGSEPEAVTKTREVRRPALPPLRWQCSEIWNVHGSRPGVDLRESFCAREDLLPGGLADDKMRLIVSLRILLTTQP